MIKAFFENLDISLEKIGFVCIDGAPAVLGYKLGFVVLLKRDKSELSHNLLHITPLCIDEQIIARQLERSDGLCSSYRKFYSRESDKS